MLAKKASTTSEEKKAARADLSSNYGLKFLSPASQKQRISRNIQERKHLKVKLDTLTPYDCNLSSKQYAEMLKVVRELNKNSCAVGDLCAKGDNVLGSENNLLRAAWQ